MIKNTFLLHILYVGLVSCKLVLCRETEKRNECVGDMTH